MRVWWLFALVLVPVIGVLGVVERYRYEDHTRRGCTVRDGSPFMTGGVAIWDCPDEESRNERRRSEEEQRRLQEQADEARREADQAATEQQRRQAAEEAKQLEDRKHSIEVRAVVAAMQEAQEAELARERRHSLRENIAIAAFFFVVGMIVDAYYRRSRAAIPSTYQRLPET